MTQYFIGVEVAEGIIPDTQHWVGVLVEELEFHGAHETDYSIVVEGPEGPEGRIFAGLPQ